MDPPIPFLFRASTQAALAFVDPRAFLLPSVVSSASDPDQRRANSAGAQLHNILDPVYLPVVRQFGGGNIGTLFLPQAMQQRLAAPLPAAQQQGGDTVHSAPFDDRMQLVIAADTNEAQWEFDLIENRYLTKGYGFDPRYELMSLIHANNAKVDATRDAANVPYAVDKKEASYLARLHKFNYNVGNGWDFIRALQRVGFFEGATSLDTDAQLITEERIDRFHKQPVNVLKTLAVLRVCPYILRLNEDAVWRQVSRLTTDALRKFLFSAAVLRSGVLAKLRASLEDSNSLVPFEDIGRPDQDQFFFRDSEECLFLSLYNQPKVIASGAFGFVIAYRNISKGTLHAVKLQRVYFLNDQNEPAYSELRIMGAIQNLTRHWNPARKQAPFNFVRLDEWVRCKLNGSEVFKALLPEMDKETKEHISTSENEVFQIIIQELAGAGNLYNAMFVNQATIKRFFEVKCFAAITAQVFCFINSLDARIEYSHNDLKPSNLLLDRQSAFSRWVYMHYRPVHKGHTEMYVPLAHTFMHVIKVADQGLASAKLAGARVPLSHLKGWGYNPARDVESYALNIVAALLLLVDLPGRTLSPTVLKNDVPAPVWRFLFRCINPATEYLAKDSDILTDYIDVLEVVKSLAEQEGEHASSKLGDQAWRRASKRAVAARAALRLYRDHAKIWRREPSESDLNAVIDALSDPLFDHLRQRPANADANNTLVMNDFIT